VDSIYFFTVERVGRSKADGTYSELIHTESQNGKCLFAVVPCK